MFEFCMSFKRIKCYIVVLWKFNSRYLFKTLSFLSYFTVIGHSNSISYLYVNICCIFSYMSHITCKFQVFHTHFSWCRYKNHIDFWGVVFFSMIVQNNHSCLDFQKHPVNFTFYDLQELLKGNKHWKFTGFSHFSLQSDQRYRCRITWISSSLIFVGQNSDIKYIQNLLNKNEKKYGSIKLRYVRNYSIVGIYILIEHKDSLIIEVKYVIILKRGGYLS